MNKHLGTLFLLCATLTASATPSNDHWLEVRSPHFTVLTDSNEKQGRRIAAQFEQMRAVFHLVLPNATGDSGSPIIVLALKDKKGFRALEPASYLAKGQLDINGLFLRAPDKNYILLRLDSESAHPFATVYHEYTHFTLSKATWLPLWLNEGLAEFYQNTDIGENDVLVGQPSEDNIVYLQHSALLPLATLFKVDHASPYYHDEQKGSIFYAESWALTHYIEITDATDHKTRLQDYAKHLVQNEDPVTAAQQAFGDLNQLQKSLERYVQQLRFMGFKMNGTVTADPASFTARPITQSEADATRADVLIHNDRNQEAEALLQATLHDDPTNALVHEAMGFLKFRQHDIPSAKKWYGEAVQLDSHSFLAHYYFAIMSLQAGDIDHDEAIESSLRTSIKLNPNFAPSFDTLAMFDARRHQKFDEAHLLNIQAITLEPENIHYRINAAEVLAMDHKFPGALSVLNLAEKVAKTPEEIVMVQQHTTSIEQRQASFDRRPAQQARNSSGQTIVLDSNTAQPDPHKVMVFRRVNGKMIGRIEDPPDYPAEDSTGDRHVIKGILRDVSCSYPTVITLTLDEGGKKITLYNNNYYKVIFTTANYEPEGDIKPCSGIEDMKAAIKYAEVTNKTVAGQILSIELSK